MLHLNRLSIKLNEKKKSLPLKNLKKGLICETFFIKPKFTGKKKEAHFS